MAKQQKTERYRPIMESYQEGDFTREQIREAGARVRELRRLGELPPPKPIDTRILGASWFEKFFRGEAYS